MTLKPPSGISPGELNLLQVVCAIAKSDGELSLGEEEFMIEQFSALFANSEEEKPVLRRELPAYLLQNLPLEDLVAKLSTDEDRELALKLSYLVIQKDGNPEEETTINKAEKVAYRHLVELLNLPEKSVEKIEWAADQELSQSPQRFSIIMTRLAEFFRRV